MEGCPHTRELCACLKLKPSDLVHTMGVKVDFSSNIVYPNRNNKVYVRIVPYVCNFPSEYGSNNMARRESRKYMQGVGVSGDFCIFGIQILAIWFTLWVDFSWNTVYPQRKLPEIAYISIKNRMCMWI